MAVFNRYVTQRWQSLSLAGAFTVLVLGAGAFFTVDAEDNKTGAPRSAGGAPLTARSEGPATATTDETTDEPSISEKHPLYLPLKEAYKAREALKSVKDYECEFMKRELMGRRLVKSTMALKMRQSPFSVYLKFLDANKGREVIYVEGRNKNNLQVHEVGIKSLVGTLSLPPTGPDAMSDNKYPVTMIGLAIMLDKVIDQWEAEGKLGEVQTQKYPDAKLPSGEECVAYESVHPTPRNQFKFHITRMWIEKSSGLVVRVEQLGFPQKADQAPPIIEEYTYSKLKTNVSLTDTDFDIKNPRYAFP